MDLDAPGAASLQVDLRRAGAQATDHPQARRGVEQVCVDDRAVAHDQRAGIGHSPAEGGAVARQCMVVSDFETAAQVMDRGFVHGFGDDNIWHGDLPCWRTEYGGKHMRRSCSQRIILRLTDGPPGAIPSVKKSARQTDLACIMGSEAAAALPLCMPHSRA